MGMVTMLELKLSRTITDGKNAKPYININIKWPRFVSIGMMEKKLVIVTPLRSIRFAHRANNGVTVTLLYWGTRG